jgi:hypothetical protein
MVIDIVLFLFVIMKNSDYSYILLLYMQEGQDLFFIRHGESLKNEAAHHYKESRGLQFDWNLFKKDPVFVQTVIYNPQLIDCHLS